MVFLPPPSAGFTLRSYGFLENSLRSSTVVVLTTRHVGGGGGVVCGGDEKWVAVGHQLDGKCKYKESPLAGTSCNIKNVNETERNPSACQKTNKPRHTHIHMCGDSSKELHSPVVN